MLKRKKLLAGVAAATAAIFMSAPAFAEWPEKPINLLIGFNAGGMVDTTTRTLLANIEKELGTTIVPIQKPGGGSAVMAATIKGSSPDGYTIGMGSNAAFVLEPLINPSLGYTVDDFSYISTVVMPQGAVSVQKDRPWNDYKSFIEDVKKSGKHINWASINAISAMAAIAIREKEGIDIRLVPNKGGADASRQMLGGHVEVTWDTSQWQNLVKSDQAKVLFSVGTERNPDYPDIPTLTESGVPYAFDDVFVMVAPKGTPDDVVQKLTKAVKASMTPEIMKGLSEKYFLGAAYRTPEDTLALFKQQQESIKPYVEDMLKENKAD